MLSDARQQGLIQLESGHINTTEKGWRHVDSILTCLLEDGDNGPKKLEFAGSSL